MNWIITLKSICGLWVFKMADVKFEDYRIEVKEAFGVNTEAALEEAAGEIVSQTKRNSRVKTGQTKNSFSHKVIGDTAYMGSDYENAIWEEFGTGDYALNGDGRKGGWFYVDDDGEGHFTHGKRPSRAFYKAYTSLKARIIAMFENRFRGL